MIAALRRWAAFRQTLKGEAERLIQHLPDQDRERQRRAARAAFLSSQTAGQRQLAGPFFGDIH